MLLLAFFLEKLGGKMRILFTLVLKKIGKKYIANAKKINFFVIWLKLR
jgi:hypothetical protein